MVSALEFLGTIKHMYSLWIVQWLDSPFPVFGTFGTFFKVSILFLLAGLLLKQFYDDNIKDDV